MTANKFSEAHRKAVKIIARYSKSYDGAALLLDTLAQAEIRMLRGETPEKALYEFVDPLASRLLKVYTR